MNDTDPNFRVDLVTGDFGSAFHNIYVTDPIRWSGLVQRLRVRPSKCDGLRNNNGTCCLEVSPDGDRCIGKRGLEHIFDPEVQIVAIRHQIEQAIEFIDTTARSIVAYVLFGEAAEAGNASFVDLFGDWHDPDACLDFYDKLDGRCYCSIPEVQIHFENKAGDCDREAANGFENTACDRQTTNASGYLSQSVDLGRDKLVQFGGYRDHLFEIWLITEGGAYERIAGPALKPQVS